MKAGKGQERLADMAKTPTICCVCPGRAWQMESQWGIWMDNSEAVKLLSALAQDTRVSIFEILSREKDSGVSAGIISTTIGASPSCISFHLKELARVGLIQGKPLGRHIIYSANFDKAAELANFILERCCSEDPLDQQEISCA